MILMLAPMAELSHRALRELITGFEKLPHGPGKPEEASAPELWTEMISAPALAAGGPFEKWYLDGGPCPERLVYQLSGAGIEPVTAAAALLDREECLGIDLNMGCAAPAITRTGAGVRWMEDPDRAARLVEAVRRVTRKRLSVKLRLGPKTMQAGKPGGETPELPPEAPEQDTGRAEQAETTLPGFDYLFRFCLRLQEAGAELITLHPREAGEKFRRRARWDYVYRLREALSIPVAGNGDIASAAELAAAATPAAGKPAGPVMAGRLAVQEPWVFAAARRGHDTAGKLAGANGDLAVHDIPGFTVNVEETGIRFLELLSLHQPPEFHPSRARRFFRYYCNNLTWAEYLRNALNREQSLAGMERVWRNYFVEHGEEREKPFL